MIIIQHFSWKRKNIFLLFLSFYKNTNKQVNPHNKNTYILEKLTNLICIYWQIKILSYISIRNIRLRLGGEQAIENGSFL